MPDLAVRLSSLHSLLTNRLAMHDRLLALSGRLDLVLSLTELRSSNQSAPVVLPKKPSGSSKSKFITATYIEGESSDEFDTQAPDLDKTEVDLDDGSIEDVEFTAVDELDENESAETSDESENEGVESVSGSDAPVVKPHINGFMEQEVEEWSGSGSESDDEAQ